MAELQLLQRVPGGHLLPPDELVLQKVLVNSSLVKVVQSVELFQLLQIIPKAAIHIFIARLIEFNTENVQFSFIIHIKKYTPVGLGVKAAQLQEADPVRDPGQVQQPRGEDHGASPGEVN